ncbi:hypothetical protein BC833DRAFT_586423 [Globomyces pollinis-pini]|nr:hypothetical protein BC833DRAFT_586423 [Globomyces pollinis-pini]
MQIFWFRFLRLNTLYFNSVMILGVLMAFSEEKIPAFSFLQLMNTLIFSYLICHQFIRK